jgi:hypothetical protein
VGPPCPVFVDTLQRALSRITRVIEPRRPAPCRMRVGSNHVDKTVREKVQGELLNLAAESAGDRVGGDLYTDSLGDHRGQQVAPL